MPLEPPATPWAFPAVARADEDGIVAIGGDLAPGTLLAAYRSALFPMPLHGIEGGPLAWWSPDPRGVLPLDELRVTRSLRRSVRGYELRVDTAFRDVIAACAEPGRPGSWITADVVVAYTRLHELGWAHSVEAWDDAGLAGGLYGVAVGGLFAGESMFHRRRDASKAALVGLVELLRADGDDRRLLDVQWATEHLRTLGAVGVPRPTYVDRLAAALEAPLPAIWA